MGQNKSVWYYSEFTIGTIFVLTCARLWQTAIVSTLEISKSSLTTKYIVAISMTVFTILLTWYLFSALGNGKEFALRI